MSRSTLDIPVEIQKRVQIFSDLESAVKWLKKDKIAAWMTSSESDEWNRLVKDLPAENRKTWTTKSLSALYSALGLTSLAQKLLSFQSVLSAA